MSIPSTACAVAFDFNGTLCDDERLLCAISAELFAEHLGWRMRSADYFARLAGLSDREILRTAVRERAPARSDPDALVETLLALRGQRYRDYVE